MKKKRISIREISEKTGVSVATVSRVINNNGRFSKETEERVRKVIDECGYHPNQLARSLRTNHMQVIGIIVPDITNEFFAKIALEIQEKLLKYNFGAIICNTNEDLQIELKHITLLRAQQVSGIIYISGETVNDRQTLDAPTVYIDREPRFTSTVKDYVLIQSDNINGGYIATKHMINQGSKYLAMIGYKPSISSHASRIEGYRSALHDFKLEMRPQKLVYADKNSVESGLTATRLLFESEGMVDGIFCTTDILAYGAMQYIKQERGLNTPNQVRVVGYDDLTFSSLEAISLTSIRQSISEFAELSTSMLIRMIDGENLKQKTYILPVELRQRKTT